MTFMKIFSYLTIFVTTVLSIAYHQLKLMFNLLYHLIVFDFNHCPENRICSTSPSNTNITLSQSDWDCSI